ncbi:PQQ-dependent sugar dehydrogenase [Aliiglaciecola litoralis]|uniref:PQQ-dependent sugar dehydrogenase n=1 Tax=Aliiglaciecola litoralis TaxID=582857 RepID=A0ABN1LQT5_9ALTE
MKYVFTALIIFLCSGVTPLNAQSEKTDQLFEIEELVTGLSYPWTFVFLSENQMLITERTGNLRHLVNRVVSEPVKGLPNDIYVNGQGGLLDVILHPQYRDNGWLYLSYAAGSDTRNTLKIIRARLKDNQLQDVEPILTIYPYRDTPVHYGARMAFLEDHTLLVTSGDGFDYREDAQKMNSLLGKILRINDDGTIPQDNPFVNNDDVNSHKIFSLGHRNPQGLVYDSNRNQVFSNEHGPDGGDEINIIRRGKNYGWPIATNGIDYSGARISPFRTYPGMQPPLVDWTPSIAPSSMVVYEGALFPQMRGDLLVSTLKAKEIRWVHMQGNEVVGQESLFHNLNLRFRDVSVHPDGSIYLLVDGAQGKILRVVPKLN